MKSLLLDGMRVGSSLQHSSGHKGSYQCQRQQSASRPCRVRRRVSSATEPQVAQLPALLHLVKGNHHDSLIDSQQQQHQSEQPLPLQLVQGLGQECSLVDCSLQYGSCQPQQRGQAYKQQEVFNVTGHSATGEQPSQHSGPQALPPPPLPLHKQQKRRGKQQGCSSARMPSEPQPFLTADLQQQVAEQIAAGDGHQADELLQAQIKRLRELKQLQAATDKLAKAQLLRPAVMVALLVQLGTVITYHQQLHRQALQQQRQQQHVQVAAQVNRDRQNRRQQYREDITQQQREEAARQQAAADAARDAHVQAQHQAFMDRVGGRTTDLFRLNHSAVHTPAVSAAAAAAASVSTSTSSSNSSTIAVVSAVQQRQDATTAFAEPASNSQASDMTTPGRTRQPLTKQQYQQQQWAAGILPLPAKQLLNRLLALVKARISEYSAEQLSLLQHWMVKLKVSDDRLSYLLQRHAVQQLSGAKPQALVPLLWGVAKEDAAAAAAAAARSTLPAGSRISSSKASSNSRQLKPLKQQQLQQSDGPALLRPQYHKAAAPQQAKLQQQQQQAQVPQANVSAAADPAFVMAWLEASVNNLSSFSASQLAASIYSLALLKQQPPANWLAAYFAASKAKMQYSSAQDLSNTLWALGTLQLLPPDAGWWGQFQVATTAALWKFTGVGIANLIWGAAKLHLQPNPQLAQLLLWQAQRKFSEMDLQLIASLVWGVAELELKPQLQWLHYLGRRIRWLQGSLTPGLTASLILSLSSLGYCPKTWMRRFLSAAHQHLQAFSTQDIANTFTAFARMRYVPKDDWLFDFLVEARRAIPQCGSQEVLCIAHALAVLSNNTEYRVHPDFLAALLARARVLAVGFSTGDCVKLAQSLVYLKVAPGVGLLSALVERFSQTVATASASDVAGMLWVFGAFWRGDCECLWLRQHPDLLQQLLNLSQQQLAARVYKPLDLKRVLAAVVAMGCNPGRAWLTAHEAAVVAQSGELFPNTLEQVLRGYRALGYQPQQGALLQQALAVKQQQQQQPLAVVQQDE